MHTGSFRTRQRIPSGSISNLPPFQGTARSRTETSFGTLHAGYNADPNQSLADYLTDWLETKRLQLKPTTYARYRDYVIKDLVPALGQVPLDELGYVHLSGYVHAELEHGRGRVTVYRILATLSSALGDAVRHHRLARNPARPSVIPRPAAGERRIWSPQEAARFLEYCHRADPLFADLIELIVGTGMRKGEALGLQWRDVDLKRRVLFVRQSLSAVDNNHLSLAPPKTRSSKNWVAISDRVAAALEHRARERSPATDGQPGAGYVFTRSDGRPLHPSYVLRHFYTLDSLDDREHLRPPHRAGRAASGGQH